MSHLDVQRARDAQILEAVQAYPMLDIALTQALVSGSYRIIAQRLHSLAEHGVIYRYPDGLNHLVGYSSIQFSKRDKPQVAHRLMASKLWITADLLRRHRGHGPSLRPPGQAEDQRGEAALVARRVRYL